MNDGYKFKKDKAIDLETSEKDLLSDSLITRFFFFKADECAENALRFGILAYEDNYFLGC